jgi:tetratricopeptide (TPR) repeat protein
MNRDDLLKQANELKTKGKQLAHKEVPGALELYEQADALYLRIDEVDERIDLLKYIGNLYYDQNDYLTARRFYEQAFHLLTDTTPQQLRDTTHKNLQRTLMLLKDWPAARHMATLILDRRGHHDPDSLMTLGYIAIEEEEYDLARNYFSRAAYHSSDSGSQPTGMFIPWARFEYQQGHLQEAAALYRLALSVKLAEIERMEHDIHTRFHWRSYEYLLAEWQNIEAICDAADKPFSD